MGSGIMQSIMIATLSQDPTNKQVTSAYVDNVYINENIVSSDNVKNTWKTLG